jgi:hypothetical protein
MRKRAANQPDAIEVNYTPIEALGLVLSNFLIEHELAWSDELRNAWEKADRTYSRLNVNEEK